MYVKIKRAIGIKYQATKFLLENLMAAQVCKIFLVIKENVR
jgi:hypothetical protein